MIDLPSMRSFGKFLIVIVIVLLILFIGSIFFGTHFLTSTIDYVVYNLSSRSGLSIFLVRGLVILLTIPFFMSVTIFTRNILGLLNLGWSPLSFYRKTSGIIIVAYVAAFWIAMYWASLHATAYKYCGYKHDGTLISSDNPGKEPVYGIELKPCTPEQILELNEKNLSPPVELTIDNAESYDWFTGYGKARVWYSVLPNGDYRFFDHPGNDPHSSQILQPINQDVIQRFKQAQAAALTAKTNAARAAAEAESAEERKKIDEAARVLARQKNTADLQNSLVQAQSEYDAANYQGTWDTCAHALSIDPSNQVCLKLRQHAAIKQAQQLVKKGELEFQRGEFDDAIWSAESALALDPTNANAIKLKSMATLTKPHAIN